MQLVFILKSPLSPKDALIHCHKKIQSTPILALISAKVNSRFISVHAGIVFQLDCQAIIFL